MSKPKPFIRGITEEYISDVHSLINSDLFIKNGDKILKGGDFQLCIRDNYINIYCKGCSVLKFSPKERRSYEIHKEYAKNGKTDFAAKHKTNVYLEEIKEGNSLKDLMQKETGFSMKGLLADPANKRYIGPYVKGTNSSKKGEKNLLSEYLKSENPFLLDLEVAYSRKRTVKEMENKTRDTVADRIDMARIVMDNHAPVLQLVEVKTATDSRVRSNPEKEPEVVKQMRGYREFIKAQRSNILKSYATIAANYLSFALTDDFPTLDETNAIAILEKFSEAPILDEHPHLLIIGSRKQMMGKMGVDHYERLKDLLSDIGDVEIWDPNTFPRPKGSRN
ncbi:MAG: hypothetical protein WA666_00315 [Nitrospirota bacterium]